MVAKCKTRNRNPCDFFMRELHVNYPKQEKDEAMIKHYLDKYTREQEPEVIRDLDQLTFGDLSSNEKGPKSLSCTKQLSLILDR